MLIMALALSALNAILGSGRALYQMALDGEFPTFFAKINEHGVPARAMGFNVVASLIIVLLGGAVEIYSFSNVGYTVSFLPVLIGYYLLRQDKPHLRRPFKLPEFMKYVALGVGGDLFRLLALRRPLVLEDRQCPDLLLAWLGDAARLPAALLVPGLRRRQAGARGRKQAQSLLELDVPTGANLAPVLLADIAACLLLTPLSTPRVFIARRRLPPRFLMAFGPSVVVVAFS